MKASIATLALAVGLAAAAPPAIAQEEDLQFREEGQQFILEDSTGTADEEQEFFSIGIDEPEPDRPVTSLRIDPSEVEAGATAEGFVGLEAPLLQATGELDPVAISLSTSDPSVAVVPDEVTTTRYSAYFPVETRPVSRPTTVSITARREGAAVEASLTVLPVPPDLASLDVRPGRIRAGRSAKATLRLAAPAAAEATLRLSSEPPGLLTMPEKVTIAAGDRQARFEVSTADLDGEADVTLTAEVGEGSAVRSVSTTVRVVP